MKLRILYLIFCIGLLFPVVGKAQLLAVKTDAFKLAVMTPNLGLEVVSSDKTSLGVDLFGNYKPWGKDMKMLCVQPELRYWFNGRPMVREYIGLSALGATYDITWGKHIYQGEALGLGLTFGYVLDIAKRWNIEFYGGFGPVFYSQKQYYVGDNYEDYETEGISEDNAKGYSLLPTKLGISISYILK